MKKIVSLFLSFLMMLSLAITTYAVQGKVTYTGGADGFIFAPGTDHSPTNLFPDLSDVMPGDRVTQQIKLVNDRSKEVKVDLYLRALGAQEGSEDFLSQLHMTVKKRKDTVMFNASADQTDGLTGWVKLGTLYSGGEVELTVTLEVPVTLGNEYMDRIGYLDWEFMAEERPVDPDDPKPPQTGDNTAVFIVIALTAAILLFLLILLRRRRKEREETGVAP